jgi:cell division protein FtsB
VVAVADRRRRAARTPSASNGKPRKQKKRTTNAVKRHPASRTPARRMPPSPRVRRRRIAVSAVLLGLAVVGFLFAFVYPTSTFLQQRAEIGKTEERIARVEEETRRLEADNERLLSDEEVERLAREQYGLVRPGETPFVLVPDATTETPTEAGDTQP